MYLSLRVLMDLTSFSALGHTPSVLDVKGKAQNRCLQMARYVWFLDHRQSLLESPLFSRTLRHPVQEALSRSPRVLMDMML